MTHPTSPLTPAPEVSRAALVRRYSPQVHYDVAQDAKHGLPLTLDLSTPAPQLSTEFLNKPGNPLAWYMFAECSTPATADQFYQVMTRWLVEPQLVIPPVSGAKLVSDVEYPLPETPAALRESPPLRRKVVRQLLPKRTTHDAIVTETIHIYRNEEQVRVHFTPELPDPARGLAQLPFYYPKLMSFAYIYRRGISPAVDETLAEDSDTLPSMQGTLGLEFALEPNAPFKLTSKEVYGWSEILKKMYKWSISTVLGYRKRAQHDVTVPKSQYFKRYATLKTRYGAMWVERWPEKTDARKFVFEDIAIATWLLCLWDGRSSENQSGFGIDQSARKVWELYGSGPQLQARTLYPVDAKFEHTEWFLGNHADELVPWIPIMAAKSHYDAKVVVIPCCPFVLCGQKLRHPTPGMTRFQTYVEYVKMVMRTCGYHVEEEHLRIPSTKNIALVGRRRTFDRDDTEAASRVLRDIDALVQQSGSFKPRISDREKTLLQLAKQEQRGLS
ncbi:tRNA(Ser) Um(44) 2'-O-methyltransferase [Dispira parvispora]|uniref:tRNA (uracil-O(2)-)-methyltransferase n=1 Tax=Dispira parvispora TaxID=1520584 RepID=A0A9W8EAB6_9FUNG|nr:tRNA(Ser) Um(44) 2'-O-methyltransferase [Dispira parvispora]